MDYLAYLNSDEWKQKRTQRLQLSKFKCSACGSQHGLQVHHLTYVRIFDEDMADLLPLCRKHHEVAERLVSKRLLPRDENVLFLATETVRLILESSAQDDAKARPVAKAKPAHAQPRMKTPKPRNMFQQRLLMEEWFLKALALKRNEFKKHCREMLQKDGRVDFGRNMANCFALYVRA